MDTEELEKYLEAGTESQRIDFKESCSWDVIKFAKDILAMSNVQDGGIIIIGVKEKDNHSFERQGATINHRNTYNRDTMMDQMASFADPHVDFDFKIITDKKGREYGVIIVRPFEEIPIICRKDSTDIKAGTLYYRNRNGRPQSSKVSNSYDMRDILSRAAIKLMSQYKSYRLKVEEAAGEILKKELGDL